MDLLEYQAKRLFNDVGIPVLPSQSIRSVSDLKALKIPYPIVLKSQVRRGGRGKAGGIRFAENTIDAIAVAQTILNLPIRGEYPDILLAEVKYDATQEFYLAITLDHSLRRPVLLGSQQGGMKVELALRHVQQVIVDREFAPFYARRLAVKMGLQGILIPRISEVIEKMYHLFNQKDLDLVEINPLGISADKQVMALDGKVVVNDNALARHPNLNQMVSRVASQLLHRSVRVPDDTSDDELSVLELPIIELDGDIAVICNGAGLTMATLDLLVQSGGTSAGFLNLGGETPHYYPSLNGSKLVAKTDLGTATYHRFEQSLKLICQKPNVKVVLINIFGSFISCDHIATILTTHLRRHNPLGMAQPKWVVRLIGHEHKKASTRLADVPVLLVQSLDDAIKQAIILAQPLDALMS
jgi:succinyl-CoA synthetase beta subunit